MFQTNDAHSDHVNSSYDQSLAHSSEHLRTSVTNHDVLEYQKSQNSSGTTSSDKTDVLQKSETGVESGTSAHLKESDMQLKESDKVSQKMSDWAAKNFSSLDLDSNGYVDFAEIDKLSHRSTVDDDPKWFENLDSLKKTYEVLQKSSNDQWFWEDGISHADLKSHSKATK